MKLVSNLVIYLLECLYIQPTWIDCFTNNSILRLYKALQDKVYIWLPPKFHFLMPLKGPATTQTWYFCSTLDSYNQDLTKNQVWNITHYTSHIILHTFTESAPGPIQSIRRNIWVSVVCRAIQLHLWVGVHKEGYKCYWNHQTIVLGRGE